MNLKKFISAVSAFAIAASAFAAMAVTASAEVNKNISVSPITPPIGVLKDNENGTYTVTGTGVGAVLADFSNFKDIDKATSVTVQFDVTAPLAKANTLAKIMYGVGDVKVRKHTGNSSSANNYNKEGLVSYFGAETTTTYYLAGNPTNYASYVPDKAIQARITLDRVNHSYTSTLILESGQKATASGSTAVDNITIIEAFTWGAPAVYDVTFKNIKVSYIVPEDATGENVTGTDGTTASLWTATVPTEGAKKVTAVATLADGKTTKRGETALETTYTGDVEVYVVVNKPKEELSGVTISFE